MGRAIGVVVDGRMIPGTSAGRAVGTLAGSRASLLSPAGGGLPGVSPAGQGLSGSGWSAWSALAVAAARAGIQLSIDSAYIAKSPGATSGSAAPGATIQVGELVSAYDLSGGMQRSLVSAGMPADVAAAFAAVTAETVGGWASGFSLSASAGPGGGPHAIALGSSTGQWRLNPGSIESALRGRLGASANASGAADALRDFATWLSSSMVRWQLRATVQPAAVARLQATMQGAPPGGGGGGTLGGAPF